MEKWEQENLISKMVMNTGANSKASYSVEREPSNVQMELASQEYGTGMKSLEEPKSSILPETFTMDKYQSFKNMGKDSCFLNQEINT